MLIPGTKLERLPLGVKDLEALSLRDQLKAAYAAQNWKWHWKRADLGAQRGYDPFCWWFEDRKPHEKQQQFHSMEAKFRGFIGGVGSGKTGAGAAELVKQAIQQPGSVWICASPTYKMLNSSTLIALEKILQREAIAYRNKVDNYIDLTNGSRIWLRSTEDPETIRGIDATGFWLDESSRSTNNAWNILVGRMRQPGYRHLAWTTTTPKGRNWVWDRFDSPERPNGYQYVEVSSRDNPFVGEDFIESLEDTYSGNFAAQEIEGKFVGLEGLVYPEFSRNVHVGNFREKEFKALVYGIDWGFSNPNVVLVIGLDGDDRMYVVDEFYESKTMVEPDMVDFIREAWEQFGRGVAVCDPSEPEHIHSLSRNGITAQPADNSVMPGIQRVAKRLDLAGDGLPRLFVDESCVETIMEFSQYVNEEQKEGKQQKEAPPKQPFDHAMDALRYATMHVDSKVGAWGVIKNKELDKVL